MKASIEHARAAHMLLAQGGQWLGRESIQDYRDRVRKAHVHAMTSIALSLAEQTNPHNAALDDLPALNIEKRGDDEEEEGMGTSGSWVG